MKRAWTILRAFVLVGLVLTAILVVGVSVFTRTDLFRDLLRRRVTAVVDDAIPGRIHIGAIEGSIWSDFTLRRVELRHGDRPAVAIGSVRLAFSIPSLLTGRLVVDAVEISNPVVELRETLQGSFELVDAVVPPAAEMPPEEEEEDAAGAGFPIEIAIDSVRIRDGRVAVRLAGEDGRTIDLSGVELRASGELLESGPVVDVGELSMRVVTTDAPPVTLRATATYAGDVVTLQRIEARTERSQIVLRGRVRDLAAPVLDLDLDLAPLAAADVRALAPAVRLGPDLEGKLAVRGGLEALRVEADLRAGDATVVAAATADLAGDVPTIDASVDGSRIDLAALLEEEGLSGTVELHAEAEGSVGAIESLRADARLTVDSLVVSGYAVGAVDVEAGLSEGKARVEGTVTGNGKATLRAAAALVGPETFSAELEVDDLALDDVLGDAGRGSLAARASVEGEGYSLETARARAEVEVRPSVLGTASIQKADLEATLDRRRLDGTLRVTGLASGETKLDSGSLAFEVADLATESMSASAELALERIRAGIELRSVSADASYREGSPREARVAVRAADTSGRSHRVVVESEIGPERIVARLRELSLELADGTWNLVAPSEIVRADTSVTISKLRVTNGERHLEVGGRVGEAGTQDLRAELVGVELASLSTFLPDRPDVEGVLGAALAVSGTAAAPVIDASARIDSLRVEGQGYEGLEAELRYADRLASADLRFDQDATHALRGAARLPLDLRWEPEVAAEPIGTLDASIRSDGLSLDLLNAFGGRTFSKVKGELFLDVAVTGPVEALTPRGTLGIRGGGVRIDTLRVPIRDLELEVDFSPTRIAVERLEAKAKEGSLDGRATVALKDFRPASVSAELALDEWPAIRTREYEAHVGGTIRAEGELASLSVRGDVEVLRGTIRPDLAFLGNQPPKRDDTILIVGGPRPTPPPPTEDAAAEGGDGAADFDVYRGAAIDVTVRIPGNTWIKQEGSSVELRGEVQAEKAPAGDLVLDGRIETVRGWVNFQGRRFRIVEGEILLTGGRDIDPRLDVVARHRAGEYTVDIEITGSASKPELELRSEPRLEQADILAVLLFGRPTSSLNEGEKTSLSDKAAGLAASFAVAEVSREVTQALGLEKLGVQIEEVSADRVAVGAYVAENTFVSVSQDVGGERGREVALEYEFLPPNWSVVTSTNTSGQSGGDVIWKKRY